MLVRKFPQYPHTHMPENSHVRLIVSINDESLDLENQERAVVNLIKRLRNSDEIDQLGRVTDPNPPISGKSFGGSLLGKLTIDFAQDKAKKVLGVLFNNLIGKSIEVEMEGNGKKMKVKVANQSELEATIETAKKFFEL
jgi:hypothetical protein